VPFAVPFFIEKHKADKFIKLFLFTYFRQKLK